MGFSNWPRGTQPVTNAHGHHLPPRVPQGIASVGKGVTQGRGTWMEGRDSGEPEPRRLGCPPTWAGSTVAPKSRCDVSSNRRGGKEPQHHTPLAQASLGSSRTGWGEARTESSPRARTRVQGAQHSLHGPRRPTAGTLPGSVPSGPESPPGPQTCQPGLTGRGNYMKTSTQGQPQLSGNPTSNPGPGPSGRQGGQSAPAPAALG